MAAYHILPGSGFARNLRLAGVTSRRHLASNSTPTQDHPYLSQLGRHAPTPSSSRLADDHVGPFPLPPGSGDRDTMIKGEAKRWKELRGREKVGWAATQTTSLIVVLAGGGLAIIVLYATGSELWSENSPTKIFEDCVDRLRESEELNQILVPPLKFHGANSSNRLRRNRRISSSLTKDPVDGREVMLVRFWVEGTEKSTDPDDNWFDTVKKWVGPAIWEDSTKPGSYTPRPTHPKAEPSPPLAQPKPPPGWTDWLRDGLGSAMGGLIPKVRVGERTDASGASTMFKKTRKPHLGEYNTGEVTALLKRDPNSKTFVYQDLYVDVPDSRYSKAHRINVPTAVLNERERGWSRLRIWQRNRSA